jgi:hypothetical protein
MPHALFVHLRIMLARRVPLCIMRYRIKFTTQSNIFCVVYTASPQRVLYTITSNFWRCVTQCKNASLKSGSPNIYANRQLHLENHHDHCAACGFYRELQIQDNFYFIKLHNSLATFKIRQFLYIS